jgi:hypothetical protein
MDLAIQNVLEEVEHAKEAEKEERDDGVLSTHSDNACTHGGHNDDESDDNGSLHDDFLLVALSLRA